MYHTRGPWRGQVWSQGTLEGPMIQWREENLGPWIMDHDYEFMMDGSWSLRWWTAHFLGPRKIFPRRPPPKRKMRADRWFCCDTQPDRERKSMGRSEKEDNKRRLAALEAKKKLIAKVVYKHKWAGMIFFCVFKKLFLMNGQISSLCINMQADNGSSTCLARSVCLWSTVITDVITSTSYNVCTVRLSLLCIVTFVYANILDMCIYICLTLSMNLK